MSINYSAVTEIILLGETAKDVWRMQRLANSE